MSPFWEVRSLSLGLDTCPAALMSEYCIHSHIELRDIVYSLSDAFILSNSINGTARSFGGTKGDGSNRCLIGDGFFSQVECFQEASVSIGYLLV